MRGRAHSPETKAAVMAALLAGQGVNEVARQYKVPASVVSGWKKERPAEEFERVRTQKGERLEELVFGYLTALLGALSKQVELFGETDYLKKQPADSNAVLHGVMADKAIRLLEAVASANANSAGGDQEEPIPAVSE